MEIDFSTEFSSRRSASDPELFHGNSLSHAGIHDEIVEWTTHSMLFSMKVESQKQSEHGNWMTCKILKAQQNSAWTWNESSFVDIIILTLCN